MTRLLVGILTPAIRAKTSVSTWAALRESFAAEKFVSRPVEADLCGIPGKGSPRTTERPRKLSQAGKGVSLADHARGVNWLSLSQGGSGKTGEPADSAVLLAKCAMALVGETETGFRVWRAKLVREKSLRGAVSLPFVSPSSPRMRLDQKLAAGCD